MDEEDWDGWRALTERLGDACQLVGDDMFVTNTERLRRGIESGVGELDPDQGQPDRHAHRDARSDRDGARGRLHRGDEPSLGRDRGRRRSPTSRWRPDAGRSRPARRSRSDRVAKYNQLLRIEEQLGASAEFPGPLARSAAAGAPRRPKDLKEVCPRARMRECAIRLRRSRPPGSRTGKVALARSRRQEQGREQRSERALGPPGRIAMLFVLGALVYLYLSAGLHMLSTWARRAATAPR